MSLLQFFSPAIRLRFYPPFWLMRIRVLQMDPLWRIVHIRLPLTWLSKNPGGAMFGGFQASLADPIAVLACLKLFPGCEVWTRNLQVNFIREGRTDLVLRFEISDQQITEISQAMAQRGRANPVFEYGFYDMEEQLCTVITCRVAIRPSGYIPRTRTIKSA
ncbi:PaaI family thioesterase [sulfur-oxidizing endosymbiont of Gigantopelta aegis]|uniref:PaaI family thioesterase n=1 Tax=sulfur-oxidizing endosymbiont of Gigantopelta aegis TaxID=2794934 RepID=UPI0018DDE9F9|nr:DUF4442 domain-containing protein [sulfur-oxidizing endosymbiont of Gigantopelta aegis]